MNLEWTLETPWGIAIVTSVIMFLIGKDFAESQKPWKQACVVVFSLLLSAMGIAKTHTPAIADIETILLRGIMAAALQGFAYEVVKNTGLKGFYMRLRKK